MISKILFITLMAVLCFVPLRMYKSRKRFMTKFCLRMTALATARKLYRMLLLIVLLTFHFLYLTVQFKDIGILGSTIAFAVFFGCTDTDKWLHRLHEERTMFYTAAITVLGCLAIPHLFTSAVSLGVVLLAAQFYPSRAILSLWQNESNRKVLAEDTDFLIEYYY